jgi:hypothetical protein
MNRLRNKETRRAGIPLTVITWGDNKQAGQRDALPRCYTPLVPRPEGGASQIMVAQDTRVDTGPRRATRKTTPDPIGRHWYVPGSGGFCLACNLPQRSRFHAPRAADA